MSRNSSNNNTVAQPPLRYNAESTTTTPRQLVPVRGNSTSAVGQPGYRFAYTWTPPTAQVFTSRVPLLRHVPLRSRPAVAMALTRVLWDCSMAENPERSHNACLHLFMFHACILHATSPRQHRLTTTGERISIHETIQSRLAMWSGQDTAILWNRARSTRKRFGRRNNNCSTDVGDGGNGYTGRFSDTQQRIRNQKRALQFAQEGAYQKAAQAFGSHGVHHVTPEVKAQLADKHPQTPPEYEHDTAISAADRASVEPVTMDEVLAAIKRFPRASAGGGSGLTITHIRELAEINEAHEEGGLLHALASLFTKWLKGRAPPRLAEWIAGAPLTPLRKSNNDVRPIAVGETLRRVAGSILLARNRDPIANHFAPHQLGVCMKRGTEVITHAVRAFMREHGESPNYGVLQLDLVNAFNLISRNEFRRLVHEHFPNMSPWVEYCYGRGVRPKLWTSENHCLTSMHGVQQGDTLGPFLFALAIQPIIHRIRRIALHLQQNSTTDPMLLGFYLGDGVMVARHEVLSEVLRYLASQDIREKGIQIKRSGTKVWWPTPPTSSKRFLYAPSTTTSQFQSHQESQGETEQLPFTFHNADGITVLGSPIGNAAHTRAGLRDAVTKTANHLEQLIEIDDAHIALTLARLCFSTRRLNHLLRCTPTGYTEQETMRFERSMQRFVTYLAAGVLDDETFKELQLPLKIEEEPYPHRGVGLTSASSIRSAAFLASFTACHHPARLLWLRTNSGNNNDHDLQTLPPPALCTNLASDAYEVFVSVTVHADDRPKLTELTAPNAQLSQRTLGALIARQTTERKRLAQVPTISRSAYVYARRRIPLILLVIRMLAQTVWRELYTARLQRSAR